MSIPKRKQAPVEKPRDKYITSRYEGRSFWVRMRLHGAQIHATFDTLEDARAYRDRMLADATTDPTHRLVVEARQKKAGSERATLGALLSRYSSEVSVTKKSIDSEQSRIRIILSCEIARLPLELVNRDAILRFMVQIRQRKISESTVRKYLMVLSAFFNAANRRWGMNVANPIQQVEKPSNGKGRERRFELGECERIVAAIKSGHPIVELLILSVETACRRGEILHLWWRDVDLEKRIAVFRNTKVNSETRVIPLSRVAVDILTTLTRDNDAKVFDISKHSISSAWSYARARAHKEYLDECRAKNATPKKDYIIGMRWHDMRHEGTSRLFEHGLELMEVASITGHKTLAMLKNYTHLKAQNLAQKLDRNLDID